MLSISNGKSFLDHFSPVSKFLLNVGEKSLTNKATVVVNLNVQILGSFFPIFPQQLLTCAS